MSEYRNWGNVVNEYYVGRFRAIAEERRQRLQKLQSREDALAYIEGVRRQFRKTADFSGRRKCPLNSHVTRSFTRCDVRIDNLIFESLEHYPVTASYYRPASFTGKLPAVLLLCGHNLEGKSCQRYRAFALSLASRGMAVLIPDPVAQGERLLPGGPERKQNVLAHNMIGKKLIALGDWFGSWRLWDAIRSCDWLAENPDIDNSRIYAAGCSGGGTMTSLIAAAEDRLAGVIPSCYMTTWCRNVENELPVDAEQVPPGMSGAGCEMADLLIAAAPKPMLILGEKDDIFDCRGTEEAWQDVRRIYGLLDCSEKAELFIGEYGHGFREDHQKACMDALLKWAGLPPAEGALFTGEEVTEEELRAVPDKQTVYDLPEMLSPDDLLQQRLDEAAAARPVLTEEEMQEKVRTALDVGDTAVCPGYRVLRPGIEGTDPRTEQVYARYLLEDKDRILGVLHFHQPAFFFHPAARKDVILYLPHDSSPEEMSHWQSEDEVSLCSFDYWGVGEMKASSCDYRGREFHAPYGSDYHYSSCGQMLGEPLPGIRVAAIAGALALLRSQGAEKITLAGAGISALPALWTAYLFPDLTREVIMINPTSAYSKLFDRPQPVMPQSDIIPGMLRWGDLGFMYEAVRPHLMTSEDFPNLLVSHSGR